MRIGYFKKRNDVIDVESMQHLTFVYLCFKRQVVVRTGKRSDAVEDGSIHRIPDFIVECDGVEEKVFLVLDNGNKKTMNREIAILSGLRKKFPHINYSNVKNWKGLTTENLAWLHAEGLYINEDPNPFVKTMIEKAERVRPQQIIVCPHINKLLRSRRTTPPITRSA